MEMLRVFLLICAFGLSFADKQNQNFRVANDSALKPCFDQGFCNLATGCCSGNGVCQVNNATQLASCVCDTPRECRPGLNTSLIQTYSGSYCQTNPGDCCTNGTDDLSFSKNGGCHLQNSTNLYPEVGARGNLLLRTGNATFADSVGIPFNWSQSIDSMVANLTAASRGQALTSGNMMGLGFLEFAIKDIVDYEYNYSSNVTFYNVTYPTLKCQTNTNRTVSVNGTSLTIPCSFANNASAVIDLGPLYDYAHRIPVPGGTLNQTGPYLDLTDAFVHWNATHHMPYEFTVALRYYAQYHYFATRNLEEFFCGQNSTVVAINIATCSIRNNTDANGVHYFATDQAFIDWLFDQARRSTIRFSQAMLQMSVLSIATEYYDSTLGRSGYKGKFDVIFQMWWNQDAPMVDWIGDYGSNIPQPSIRQHQEWNNNATQTGLAHTLQAGLNPLIALRNTAWQTSTADSLLNNPPYDCAGYVTGDFAKEVVRLSHTPLQRYGSQILNAYKADVAIELYKAGQLGLGYQTLVTQLTNSPNVSDLGTSPINFLFGTLTETHSTRQYFNTIASTALASIVEINYVTSPNVDRTGYYHYNSSYLADGNRFHPDPRFITIPAYDFLNMWSCPEGSSSCSNVSINAAALVLGYDPRMDPDPNVDPYGPLENPTAWRSQGLTYNGPSLQFVSQDGHYELFSAYVQRINPQWQLLADFLNPLFYQWDGLVTLAVKQVESWGASTYFYLPNPIVDSIPTNIGWSDINYDGFCYDGALFTGDTCRNDNSFGICYWWWTSS